MLSFYGSWLQRGPQVTDGPSRHLEKELRRDTKERSCCSPGPRRYFPSLDGNRPPPSRESEQSRKLCAKKRLEQLQFSRGFTSRRGSPARPPAHYVLMNNLQDKCSCLVSCPPSRTGEGTEEGRGGRRRQRDEDNAIRKSRSCSEQLTLLPL